MSPSDARMACSYSSGTDRFTCRARPSIESGEGGARFASRSSAASSGRDIAVAPEAPDRPRVGHREAVSESASAVRGWLWFGRDCCDQVATEGLSGMLHHAAAHAPRTARQAPGTALVGEVLQQVQLGDHARRPPVMDRDERVRATRQGVEGVVERGA